jgi:hypothetical protein
MLASSGDWRLDLLLILCVSGTGRQPNLKRDRTPNEEITGDTANPPTDTIGMLA